MHRHNVGFMALDVIADVHGFGAPAKKFQGWLQDGRIGRERVLILKPATYMNESGRSVRAAMDFYKLEDRKSVVSGKSVSVRVELGGRRILKKTNNKH